MNWRKKLTDLFRDDPGAPAPPAPKEEAPPEVWPKPFRTPFGNIRLIHEDGRIELPHETEAIREGMREDARLMYLNADRGKQGLRPFRDWDDARRSMRHSAGRGIVWDYLEDDEE